MDSLRMVGWSVLGGSHLQFMLPQLQKNKSGWPTSISALRTCWKSQGRRHQTLMLLYGSQTARRTRACTARRCSSPWSTGGITAGSVAWCAATCAPPRDSCCQPRALNHWGCACPAMMSWPCRGQGGRTALIKEKVIKVVILVERMILMRKKMVVISSPSTPVSTAPLKGLPSLGGCSVWGDSEWKSEWLVVMDLNK